MTHRTDCESLVDSGMWPCTCAGLPTPTRALTREQVEAICLDFVDAMPAIGQRAAIVRLSGSDAALRQTIAQQAQELEELKQSAIDTANKHYDTISQIQQDARDAIKEDRAQQVERLKVMEAELGELKLRLNCPILAPSCLVCGQVKPFAITHLEARAIGVCEDCRSASQQLAAMREERDEAVAIAKGLTEPDEVTPADIDKVTETLGMVGRLQQQLAASQARVRELEDCVYCINCEKITPSTCVPCSAHKWAQLQATLAEREQAIKELEHEAMQEGEQFRRLAQEIITPTMRVADTGPISFGKLKEVVEAAIYTARQDAARLRERLAKYEVEP